MKLKQTIRNLVLSGFLLIPIVAASVPYSALAAESCGNVETAIIKCEQDGSGSDINNSGIWGILILTINIMTAGVGVLVVVGFVYGGILYISSGGSPEQVKKARTVFTNVVIGVIAFGGMFTLLNFIIPGGVFN